MFISNLPTAPRLLHIIVYSKFSSPSQKCSELSVQRKQICSVNTNNEIHHNYLIKFYTEDFLMSLALNLLSIFNSSILSFLLLSFLTSFHTFPNQLQPSYLKLFVSSYPSSPFLSFSISFGISSSLFATFIFRFLAAFTIYDCSFSSY